MHINFVQKTRREAVTWGHLSVDGQKMQYVNVKRSGCGQGQVMGKSEHDNDPPSSSGSASVYARWWW
jgi:hypothetical protein